MPSKLEYHLSVKGRNRAMVAVLAPALIAGWSVRAQAQTAHGVPPSVTSQGFGGTGNAPRGLPPSVTSLGFGRVGAPPGQNHHRHNPSHGYGGVFYFPYAYPYVVDGPPSDAYDDEPYNGGPTVFDSRGSGPPVTAPDSSYDSTAAREDVAPAPVQQADATPQPPTVLIFKDGHELEVANYAIVGTTLYDLSQERRWKIALSELDLPATVKQNDDRGLEFVVPTSVQSN